MKPMYMLNICMTHQQRRLPTIGHKVQHIHHDGIYHVQLSYLINYPMRQQQQLKTHPPLTIHNIVQRNLTLDNDCTYYQRHSLEHSTFSIFQAQCPIALSSTSCRVSSRLGHITALGFGWTQENSNTSLMLLSWL